MNWIRRLLPSRPAARDGDDDAQNQVRALQLDLDEQQQRAEKLQQELRRRQSHSPAELEQAVEARLRAFLEQAAAPAVQLITQDHLVQREGKALATRDVLLLARRLAQCLCDVGLTYEHEVGEHAAYDPSRHAPVSRELNIEPGAMVTVRFVGASHGGRILRKAMVSAKES